MKKILVSGFSLFAGHQENPSRDVLPYLYCEKPHQIHQLVLPVAYQQATCDLNDAISAIRPDFVLMLGLAQNRAKISLEKVALNLGDANLADQQGHLKLDQILQPNAPAAIISTLPLRPWVQSLQRNYPVELSHSAGAYVCNSLYFHCLHQHQNVPSLFVHLPSAQAQIESAIPIQDQAASLNALLSLITAFLYSSI